LCEFKFHQRHEEHTTAKKHNTKKSPSRRKATRKGRHDGDNTDEKGNKTQETAQKNAPDDNQTEQQGMQERIMVREVR